MGKNVKTGLLHLKVTLHYYDHKVNIRSIQTRSYMRPAPIAIVVIAAAYLRAVLILVELESLTNGIPMSVLIPAMPAIEPAPKIAMYANPSGIELIVDNTMSSSAPLPAIP